MGISQCRSHTWICVEDLQSFELNIYLLNLVVFIIAAVIRVELQWEVRPSPKRRREVQS